ncbi:receptor-like cytosolic serine/threonine-protein kinase RBK1 [Punica granatum]|uniref:Receptor-like cytosolic serine/threonine-protein kinase RBK1 n=2 Tax=Punica granatum TaxID=22663 RepID=A0A6P8CDC4_PUNGR|nr:receptor-like cytosolic serine/threonine-protein kinase RBK1 [Punica granatum]XP_031379003.1 receptor-like cytosolic serine/threonine-protein kinase RBK1 [Punica granatum]OWM80422.1 hypothetical protein CDL15_Pgr019702 [Punica granatum]PKI52849.1 hypothetical protein CRG98_026680 [Punica granatum]
MTVFEQVKAVAEEGEQKKCVLVGIRFDSRSRELLNWALVKVADPGDRVVALHVCCRGSDHALQGQSLLDSYLEVYEGLCNVKKVQLKGHILCTSSIRRALVREAKKVAAAALLVGIDKHSAFGIPTGTAKYCAKRLPLSTDVLAIHNGKIVFRRFGHNQLTGVFQDPRPSLYTTSSKESQSEFAESETETEDSSSELNFSFRDNPMPSKSAVYGSTRISSVSISECSGDQLDSRPGWPLLRTAALQTPAAVGRRNISVVQWAMSLPDRSQHISATPRNISSNSGFGNIHTNNFSAQDELSKQMDLLINRKTSDFAWVNFEVLRKSTSQFSSENLIGKGGSNRVYRGTLSDGSEVAVKVLKSTKESRRDFALEVDIISSLKHRFIIPLHGICIQNDNLFSIYDFFPKGSLEENLHGNGENECGLLWKARYNIALRVAEALNYLHNEISRPVIHRDVKSSNILLTDDFEPKLSDFGLAMWAPTDSLFLEVDLVGTFGYLAPEYFMSGKVSDRIDVYSFGVVLLELLSGRKPISSEASKGQESLIMWAKPIIESGDIKGILDPRLDGDINEVELRRMVLAATLCLTQAARLRPSINQILKILRGECDMDPMVSFSTMNLDGSESTEDNHDDEVYPESCAASHLGLALLDICDDFTSFSSLEQRSNILFVEEYMNGRWSRSSSFE